MFGNNLKALRKRLGISQEQLANILGISDKTVSSWEIGRTEPNMGMVQKIADTFSVSTDELIKDDFVDLFPISISSGYRLPIFTEIPASCGTGTWAEDDVMDYIVLPTSLYKFNKNKKYFGQTAKGDSMIGAGIDDGDLLIFEQCSAPENNMVGAFSIDDERCVCKRIKFIDDKIFLVSANDNYMPIEVKDNFRMVGLLKYVVKEFRQ